MPSVAIFGNSQTMPGKWDYDTAELLGFLLAKSGFDIITGGFGGVMEAALKGASSHPVDRIGVPIEGLQNREKNKYVKTEISADSYLERLEKLIELASAFIVMPGGTGTLLELSAVWALKERGLLGNKPIICIGELWQEVAQTMGFYSERILETTQLLYFADTADDAIIYVSNFFNNKN